MYSIYTKYEYSDQINYVRYLSCTIGGGRLRCENCDPPHRRVFLLLMKEKELFAGTMMDYVKGEVARIKRAKLVVEGLREAVDSPLLLPEKPLEKPSTQDVGEEGWDLVPRDELGVVKASKMAESLVPVDSQSVFSSSTVGDSQPDIFYYFHDFESGTYASEKGVNFDAVRDAEKLEKAIENINKVFRDGKEAYEVIYYLRMLPRPIVVDFNNVIANNIPPFALNPYAINFLKDLRDIGNVVIVTSAIGWKWIQGFLKKHGLWSNDMVLMTAANYKFLCRDNDRYHDGFLSQSPEEEKGEVEAERLREEFLGLGWSCEEGDLVKDITGKVVAPIFGKIFEIPIIDDNHFATEGNPGMFGIHVKAWGKTEEEKLEISHREREGEYSLTEALGIVRSYYTQGE